MSNAVAIKRYRNYGAIADCEQCDKLHPDSTRERCRVHVQQTGHTVRYLIEDVTVYRPASRLPGTGPGGLTGN